MSRKYIFLSVLAFAACLFLQASAATAPFPQAVINEMASREMRYHHFMWHNIRDRWNKLSSSSQAQLRKIGWAPPRPSKRYDSKGNAIAITDNNSGEDFLYMHRQMINKVNTIITQRKDPYGNITGWKTLPVPGDKAWPVPPSYTIPGNSGTTQFIKNVKTNSFYLNSIRAAEKTFTNPAELKKMTLGEMGSKIEFTIHQWLHLRFSRSSSMGYRPGTSSTLPNVDQKWDTPKYNWLGDTYASQVDPVFWKLHGWVDDRIEDWRRAHNLRTIKWKGTWVGGPMGNLPYVYKSSKRTAGTMITRGSSTAVTQAVHEDNLDETMREVAKIFAEAGIGESSFAEKVMVDFKPSSK